MNEAAETYVKLVLSLGRFDSDYVDAYYGPEEWRSEAAKAWPDPASIRSQAEALSEAVADLDPPSSSDEDRDLILLRHRFLTRQLEALISRTAMLEGRQLSFDEESKALYDAVAPTIPDSDFESALQRLDSLLPGEGPIDRRLNAFRNRFVIPPDRLDAVFKAAVAEARTRTKRFIELPEQESFSVEYVTDKPWSGYNWYQGGSRSLIQVNTDFPIYIDRAVDLACHEGYPGHHVYNVLLEDRLVNRRGWVEYSVYPLFSPMSLIAEGSANYGIQVAFSQQERLEFEKQTLFPLAGLDPSQAERYYQVMETVALLSYAGNEAARRYLDSRIDAQQAAQRLERFALMSPERAAQRVRFIDKYRSYVINYNLGQDLVRDYIESRLGEGSPSADRWKEFEALISSPRLPSGLVD